MHKFKWLLFDIDNTLLDFSGTAKISMFKTFADFNRVCTDDIYEQYQVVNHAVWDAFERAEITAEELRIKRMRDLFDVLKDDICTPAEFGQRYMENIVAASTVYKGVPEMLDNLGENYILSVITNGLKEAQRPRLQRLGLIEKFESITVSDEIGVAKPHREFFNYALQSIENPPPKEQILVIGDSLNSDIAGGIGAGLATCWISHGKENHTTMQPDFVIKEVLDLPSVLQ